MYPDRTLRPALVLALATAVTAAAQSFNVDFNVTSGTGAGVPASSYGAGAEQPGHWNSIISTMVPVITLADVDGVATSVQFSRTAQGTFVSAPHASFYGDWEKLLEDVHLSPTGQSLVYSFSGLAAGYYAVFTYALKPDQALDFKVSVPDSTSTPIQTVGDLYIANCFLAGRTHAVHIKYVPSGGSVGISVTPAVPGQPVAVGAIQLVKMDGPRLRLHVNDTFGSDTNYSGGSWQNHLTSLHTALEIAALVGGENAELWLARGTYRCAWDNDRTRSFVLPSGVHLYGGFAGTETELDERPEPWGTTLSGSAGQSGDPTDDAYTVLIGDDTGASTLVDGVSISYAQNDANTPPWGGYGGGVRLVASTATLRHCTISSNYARHAGGAVYSQGGSPTFIDCFFVHNDADSGGALHHQGGGNPQFFNCRFTSNEALWGGVLRNLGGGVAMTNCYLQANAAVQAGGAVYALGGAAAVTLTNCTVVLNTAGAGGGAYATSGADLHLHNSIFWGNTAGGGDPLAQQYQAVGSGSLLNVYFTTAEGAPGADGADPQFADAAGHDGVPGTYDDDFRLGPVSPCIDAGSNYLVPLDSIDLDQDGTSFEFLPLDFDYAPRLVDHPGVADTGQGPAPVVDRGAWEYNPADAVLVGDLNCDGAVDFGDINPFVLRLSNPAGYAATYPACPDGNGDIGGDGTVGFEDINPFVALLAGGS